MNHPRPRVRYLLAVSLDGLIGPHDGSVDWLAPFESLTREGEFVSLVKEVGGLLMGRLTYEQQLSFGPGPFSNTPTVVLSSNSSLEVGPSAEVCTEGPRAAIDALAKRVNKGDFWLFGGGQTASTFLEAGLVDRIELTTVPVVLGEGKPLFPGAHGPATFELVSSTVGKLGTISTVYARRG